MLRGQDLRPWYQIENGLYLIFTHSKVDIERYPAVKAYLEQFRDHLEPKPRNWTGGRWIGRKAGSYLWYQLQDQVTYFEEFEKPKIVWADISKLPRFSFNENSYLVNTGFLISDPEKWVLGVLQSRVLWFAISQIAQPLRLRAGLWQYRVLPQYVERLPIPELTPPQEAELSQIIEQITALARARYVLHEAVREHIVAELSGGGTLNTKLTEWWDLDGVDDLRDEARKAFKRAIPANKHGEWGRLLAAKQEEHAQLTAQIVKLETRMNAVVYEAFDLTPEEIALIEEKTKYPYGAV
jgi:hypothetical protein